MWRQRLRLASRSLFSIQRLIPDLPVEGITRRSFPHIICDDCPKFYLHVHSCFLINMILSVIVFSVVLFLGVYFVGPHYIQHQSCPMKDLEFDFSKIEGVGVC